MKKFIRQKTGNVPTADINLDFGAAAAKVARVFEPGDYRLRIDSARVIQGNENVLVALDLVMAEGGGGVASRALWVDGPNAAGNQLVENNKHLVAQLLTLAGLPTSSGNVGSLIPKLTALQFAARLVLDLDKGSGRVYNALAEIYVDDAP